MFNQIEDGYYISAYCSIDSLGNILQTAFRHDQNISLWKFYDNKLELIHHWEIERLSGMKHNKIPFYCVEDFNQLVVELIKPYDLKFQDIKAVLGIKETAELFNLHLHDDISYHSICHLYSSLLSNTEEFYTEDFIVLALDGGPDFEVESNARKKYFYAGAYSIQGKVDIFPISSPGMLWANAREYFALPEGTLMALAYASSSESYYSMEKLPQIFNYTDSVESQNIVNILIQEILSYRNEDAGIKFNHFDDKFSEEENKISMIMKIIQTISIKMVDQTIEEILKKYHLDPSEINLSLCGGYSLNCPNNTHLMHTYRFKKQVMIPCTNDGGQAIGIGLKYFYDNLEKVNFKFKDAYYGDSDDSPLDMFSDYIEDITNGLALFVDDIINYPLIWFSGRSEVGPRALGHRSILADPRKSEFKDILNRIKQREWWRPVAPIVLSEECSNWFENSFESPYMLNNFVIRQTMIDKVPAIMHIDKTARVQTIDKSCGELYDVLKVFYSKTGVPIICNTSLNDKGEPIINSINQAINFALRKNIKIIYYNGKRIVLKNHDNYNEKLPLKRHDECFTKYKDNVVLHAKLNPFGISNAEYFICKTTVGFENIDVTKKEDVAYLKRFSAKVLKMYHLIDG